MTSTPDPLDREIEMFFLNQDKQRPVVVVIVIGFVLRHPDFKVADLIRFKEQNADLFTAAEELDLAFREGRPATCTKEQLRRVAEELNRPRGAP